MQKMTVFTGGNVYLGPGRRAESFAVEDGIFTFVGSDEEARGLIREGAEEVPLGGRFVCPGFNDSHMHLLSLGNGLRTAALGEHTGSLADMLECLRAHGAARPGDEWILGRGWNQDYFSDEKRLPGSKDLDKVSTTRPVCAVRACGHMLAVNTRALELLGVTGETAAPEGGRIGMEQGEPDGRFYDAAMDLVYARMPAPGLEELKEMLRSAARTLNAYGITSSQTDDYCVFKGLPWETVNEAYRALEAEGALTVRVYEQANFSELSEFERFVEQGNRTGAGSPMFRIGPLKLLGDGALGPRTAYLSRPYADAPDTRGIPVFSQETLDALLGYANREGLQAAVHAIGDGCLDRVLLAFERALREHPREDHRHGVVHCQITRPEQLKKIRALGLRVYAQSIFLDYDAGIVEARVGTELAATSYAWKTLMDMGVSVSNGSDCPVERPAVLRGIQCAVTRRSVRDPQAAYRPEEAFTLDEALLSFTREAASASFEEQVKGQIAPGMYADFTVLGADPFEVEPQALSQVPVEETWLGGKCVYRKEQKEAAK